MKAIEFRQYGSPDVLEFVELPKPEPKDNEVLVRIVASSINSWDWEFLTGTPLINRMLYGLFRPKLAKRVLGADFAGIVENVGPQVSRFKPGDRIFGDLWDSWGGFAEFACIDESSPELMPANSTFLEAATLPQAGVLALQGLRKGEPLTAGQKVLINGGGGGVGTFAIQLAKRAGTNVTGVDAAHKLDTMRAVGADHVIDFNEQDFTATGEQYDLIVDCQNFRPMRNNLRALKPGGTFAMIGGSIPRVYELWFRSLLSTLTRETRKVFLVSVGPNKGLAELSNAMEAGILVPVIDRVFSFEEIPDALRYFGKGRFAGKIAIEIASS